MKLSEDAQIQLMLAKEVPVFMSSYVDLLCQTTDVPPETYLELMDLTEKHMEKRHVREVCATAQRRFPEHAGIRQRAEAAGINVGSILPLGSRPPEMTEQEFLTHMRIVDREIRDLEAFFKITEVHLDLLLGCNYSCYHCYYADYLWPKPVKPYFVPFALLEDKIKAVSRLIGRIEKVTNYRYNRASIRVMLTGPGEPLLHPQYADVVALVKKHGFTPHVITNGSLLSGKKAQALVDAGMESMHVSLDAFSPELYAKFRRQGNLPKVVANIEAIMKACRQRNHEPKLSVTFCYTKENCHEVKDFLRYWLPRVFSVTIQRFFEVGASEEYRTKATEKLFSRTSPCQNIGSVIGLSYTGGVTSCMCGQAILGNTHDRSLEHIFLSPERISMFAHHERGEYDKMPEACQTCSSWGARHTAAEGVLVVDGKAYHATKRVDGLHIGNFVHKPGFTLDDADLFPEIPVNVARDVDSREPKD